MSLTPQEEALALRYLMGEAAEDERTSVEERIFQDDEFFAELDALRDELVNDYVTNRLSPESRQSFQRWLEQSATMRREVAFASSLARSISTSAGRSVSRDPPRTTSHGPIRNHAVMYGLVAALVIAVLGSSWLLLQVASISRRSADLQTANSGLTSSQVALEAELERSRTAGARLTQEVEAEKARADRLAREQPASAAIVRPVVEFVLTPRTTERSAGSSAASSRLVVDTGADVRFQIELPADARNRRYMARIETVAGQIRWSQQSTVTRVAQLPGYLVLRLPPAALPQDDYLLVVGPPDSPIASYEFSIIRR